MKILVVCQHYWPEPYPLADICEGLAERGHTVHVITGVPNYPMGYIYSEYKNGNNRLQEHNGVQITRTFTIGRRNNVVFRALNYVSFAASSTLCVKNLKEEYDVVFTNQTSPVTMSLAALVYAKKWKKKCLLYCMDLWPASLRIAGTKEKCLVYRVAGYVAGCIYRAADRVLITSRGFRDYLQNEHGVDDERITYLPQYADDIFDEESPVQQSKDSIDLIFAGNIGKAQSLQTVLLAASVLQDVDNLQFHIVGDGQELENLKMYAAELGLENVIFHGRKPLESMPMIYSSADAMIVSITDDPTVSMTLPRKVQTYMAAGKPILAAANGEAARVLRESQCGLCSPSGDYAAFEETVCSFIAMPSHKQRELGRNARKYYLDHFSKESFFKVLTYYLENG